MQDSVHRAIGGLEAKVDIILAHIEKAEKDDKERDARISVLEHDKTAQKAAVGIIATVVTLLVTVAEKFFLGRIT